MKKIKKILFILPIFVIIGILVYSSYEYNNSKNINIEKILKTNSYSYLSSNVKDYIRDYYNDTGEVLLTEKNKVVGKEYLNPDYIEYLNDESDIDSGYVPNVLTSDYNYSYNLGISNIDNLPRKYDSRNVNGNNYVTPTKKQYSNLCWSYAFTSIIESKLLKEGLKKDALSLNLAERMIDYATTDPISVFDTEKNPYFGNYDLNSLAESGNEFRYSSALVNGLFPINESDWKYETEYMGKVKPEDVYDLSKTDYQVNEVKFLEDNNYTVGFDENTNKILKQYIIDNGSIGLALRVGAGNNYVRYNASIDERLNSDVQYNYLYYKDVSALYQSNDHAVAIIGWDDDYVRNICVLADGKLKDSVNNNGIYSCSEGTLKKINGAWIIKDSANSLFHYVAYETVNSDYYVVTDVSYKDWDNVYSSSNSDAYTKNDITYIFNKQNNSEKIKSIKFYANKKVTNLRIYINTYDGTGEKLLTTINTEIGGMYTIPITSEFILSDNKFSIKCSGDQISQFSIFTSNLDNNVIINFDDARVVNSFNYQSLLEDYHNLIVTNGISRNVYDTINYVIKDSNNKDVTNLFNITRNYSVGNYINSLIRFDNDVALGEYTVYAYVNNSLYETFKINISNYMEKLSGDGSEENPFIITNPAQLDMMRLNKYNYYKLGNDIDLTYDTQNKNGLFYNDGLGWEPISYSDCRSSDSPKLYCAQGFSGAFDGDNHKIVGLYINRPEENAVGLFKNTSNENFSGLNFRNIILKDVNITGNNYVGGLIGYAYGTTYERTLIFENISVTGNIKGNNYIGGLIGYFKGGTGLNNYLVSDTNCTKRHCLDNLFNSSKIEGNNYAGGIVGLLETQEYYNVNNASWRSTIDANYWQNNGTIISSNNAAGLIGHIIINNGNIVTLNDSINTGLVKSTSNVAIVNDTECNNKNNTYPNCKLVLNNIYYTNDNGYKNNTLISANNVKKYDIVDLTNYSIYNSFTNFKTVYKTETINNIKRIPFLKNAYLKYTDAHDIVIDGSKRINLYDYIDGSDNIVYNVLDKTIASVGDDGIITPLKNGTTTIHITSYYDGYDDDIKLTVNLSNTNYTITYNLNGGIVDNPTTYTINSNTFTLKKPTKNGYTFVGWTGSNGNTLQLEVTITKGTTGDLIYNANWTPLKYNVTFDSNGGTGTMKSQTFTYDVSQKITSNLYEKEGYAFAGWNTKADGTGTYYSDGQNVKITKDLKLYAIWKEKFDYVISKYSVDKTNKYINLIDINTTIEDFKKNIELNNGYSIDVDYKSFNSKNILYTGGKTKIYKNNKLYIEYTNIVTGDVNGNGKIDIIDYIRIMKDIMDEITLSGEYYKAADVNQNGKVDIYDYIRIMKKIMEE